MQGGGLIKLLDTYVTADISVRTSGRAKLNASTICDYIPWPLASWWKSVDVVANGVALSVSHTDNLIVSSIFSRLFERKNAKEDLYGCNMGWEDVPDKRQYLHDVTDDDNANNTRAPIIANTGTKKRIDSIVNADPQYCIEKMLMLFFNSGDQYIPTNNTLRMKFTRESQHKFLTMSEHKYAGTESAFHHGVANASGDGAECW